ncbi:MAG: hypothetical protein QME92_08785 [Bacillota bacterium]|nr:hypothetical protein [Bacillota bacterium]
MGGVVAGWVAERLPLAAVYWCMSGVGALGLIVFLCGYRRYCFARQGAVASQPALAEQGVAAGRAEVE